jgi:hypothetical protein
MLRTFPSDDESGESFLYKARRAENLSEARFIVIYAVWEVALAQSESDGSSRAKVKRQDELNATAEHQFEPWIGRSHLIYTATEASQCRRPLEQLQAAFNRPMNPAVTQHCANCFPCRAALALAWLAWAASDPRTPKFGRLERSAIRSPDMNPNSVGARPNLVSLTVGKPSSFLPRKVMMGQGGHATPQHSSHFGSAEPYSRRREAGRNFAAWWYRASGQCGH